MVRTTLFISLLALGLVVAGCGSGSETANPTADERFAKAMALYDKGDYLEAINEFTVITLQYQGSQHASDAQYYLAECRYNREEYLLAAFEYGVMKRSYPASPRAADAQYKLAMSYYRLSPPSSLDQKYTRKAIDEFQTFIEYYPTNPLAVDAATKIRELDGKLAKKVYDAAQQYALLERYKSALQYYDDVIDQYHDSDYAPLAWLDKIQLLIDRKRYPEAQTEMTRFLTRYPNSVLRGRADALQDRLTKEMKSAPAEKSGGTASIPPGGPGTPAQ